MRNVIDRILSDIILLLSLFAHITRPVAGGFG